MIKKLVAILLSCTVNLLGITQSAHLAGSWYPSNPQELLLTLDIQQKKAAQNYNAVVKPQTVKVIITPHAGIKYSGTIASSVYRLANPQTKQVIILAPDHSGRTRGVALPAFNNYSVPNGTLSVDSDTIKKLAQRNLFNINTEVFNKEHSLEMQLPFVTHYFKNTKIVPLIVGPITCAQSKEIAHALQTVITKDTLVVVSCDFVHYGKRFNYSPFKDHQQLRTRALNGTAIQLIENQQCAPFEQFIQQTKATICGSHPIKVLLALLKQKTFGTVEPRFIGYDTSSKQNAEDFVSYVGLLFTTEQLAQKPVEHKLTQYEQTSLLTQAQDVLNHLFDTDYSPALYFPIPSFGLRQKLGAFTTLRKKDNSLRGCIGHIIGRAPLYKTVATATKSAALNDSRFKPVTKTEVPNLDLKLSILDIPKVIPSYNDFIVGKHGIILEHSGKSAVYLREVATEQDWNREQTLQSLAQKAGLPKNAWQSLGATFKVFASLDIS